MFMKKLAVLLVLLTFCSAAMAETLDVSNVDCTVDLTRRLETSIELADTSAYADKKADTVTRNDNVYEVDNGNLRMTLDLSKYPGFLCFTQDMYASFESYLAVSDPNALVNELIDEKVHFFLYDMETNLQIFIYENEADNLSALVGDFSKMSADNQKVVASRIASNCTIQSIGENSWLLIQDGVLVTICNGQYVIVEFGGSDDAAADMEDTQDILSHMRFN